jgi:hypothetical protein
VRECDLGDDVQAEARALLISLAVKCGLKIREIRSAVIGSPPLVTESESVATVFACLEAPSLRWPARVGRPHPAPATTGPLPFRGGARRLEAISTGLRQLKGLAFDGEGLWAADQATRESHAFNPDDGQRLRSLEFLAGMMIQPHSLEIE